MRRAATAGLLVAVSVVPSAAARHLPCPPPSAAARAIRAVVEVSSGSEHAVGFTGPSGRIMTVAHVLGDPANATINRPGGPAAGAEVLRRDLRLDAAVLAGPAASRLAELGRAASMPACVAVATVRAGRATIVPATARRVVMASIDAPAPASRPSIELGAALRRGDSGAPVIDQSGRVIGMVFAIAADGSDTAWATAATEFAIDFQSWGWTGRPEAGAVSNRRDPERR